MEKIRYMENTGKIFDVSEYELIFDLVLIKPDEVKSETETGVLLSGDSQKKPTTGIVISTGKGIQAADTGVWIEIQVSVGDHVIYDSFASVPFMESEFVIIEAGYIKCKIKN